MQTKRPLSYNDVDPDNRNDYFMYEINESLKIIASYFEHKLEKEKGRRA